VLLEREQPARASYQKPGMARVLLLGIITKDNSLYGGTLGSIFNLEAVWIFVASTYTPAVQLSLVSSGTGSAALISSVTAPQPARPVARPPLSYFIGLDQ
jgi:hypothetical protein